MNTITENDLKDFTKEELIKLILNRLSELKTQIEINNESAKKFDSLEDDPGYQIVSNVLSTQYNRLSLLINYRIQNGKLSF